MRVIVRANPLLSSNTDINPAGDWNRVFIPYCTGDTYLGSRVNTYVDPDGAGTAQGYLLADSGPIVPATLLNGQPSNQGGLFSAVSTIWGVDTMIQSLPTGGDRIVADFGEVNALVSESFPNDRLAVSIFERDYNYIVATYESAFPIFSNPETSVDTGAGRTEIYRLTSEDLDNLSYYMPYYRNTNTSHCLTVTGLEDVGSSELEFLGLFQQDPSAATWSGTEIETDGRTVTYKDFIEQLLDDSVPQQSYYEGTGEGKYQVCALDCEAYDAVMCDEAVQ